jgi:translation initiation factor 1A
MADEFEDNSGNEEENNSEGAENQNNGNGENGGFQPIGRVRIPRGKEVLGKVDQRVGANRMLVTCFDGKQRNCRVPGRLKRALWIRPGNVVLVEPWEFEGDKKGDIIFSYTPAHISWLERKGFLRGMKDEF